MRYKLGASAVAGAFAGLLGRFSRLPAPPPGSTAFPRSRQFILRRL